MNKIKTHKKIKLIKNNNNMKLFVWDFHGVLEEGNENAVLEISNIALQQLGFKQKFTRENIETLYGKKWWKYFQQILPNEPVETCLKLQEYCITKGQDDFTIIQKYIKATPHSHEVLKKIGEAGHEQILISNTSPRSLQMFVDSVKVRKYFKTIIPLNNHLTLNKKNKLQTIKEYLEGKTYEKIIIIGDSAGDMEMKQNGNAISYLYTHPYKKFIATESDYKINDLRNVLNEI